MTRRPQDPPSHRAPAHLIKTQASQITMNTRISSVLILAAALSVSALVPVSAAPAPQGTVPMAYSVSRVDINSSQSITRGATAWTVQRLLGTPRQKLSGDTWVYSGYQADFKPANDQQCDTLVLTVVRGEVSDIKLVNHRAAQLIAAHAETKATGMIAASK